MAASTALESTSRWVTNRTVRSSRSAHRTPTAASSATRSASRRAVGDRRIRCSSRRAWSPQPPAAPSPSARRRALAWSSASRSTWLRRACSAPAARTPAWRMPPPEQLAVAAGPLDRVRRRPTTPSRPAPPAPWRSRTLTESTGADQLGAAAAAGDGRVPEPGAVHVHAHAVPRARLGDGCHDSWGNTSRPAAERVLDADEALAGMVDVGRVAQAALDQRRGRARRARRAASASAPPRGRRSPPCSCTTTWACSCTRPRRPASGCGSHHLVAHRAGGT